MKNKIFKVIIFILVIAIILMNNTTLVFAISGLGTEESKYIINTAEDLMKLKEIIDTDSSKNYYVQMNANIDMSEKTWTGINEFRGVFDGNGHTINKLTGTKGLVQDNYGTIKNLKISNANISGTEGNLGIIAGQNDEDWSSPLISNCMVSGNVEAEGYSIGGIVGWNKVGTIEGCFSNATVRGWTFGGLVGSNYDGGNMKYCVYYGQDIGIEGDSNYGEATEIYQKNSDNSFSLYLGGATVEADMVYNTMKEYTEKAGLTLPKCNINVSATNASVNIGENPVTTTIVDVGSNLTLSILPNGTDYRLSSVKVNGVEKLDEVDNNQLQLLGIAEDLQIEVEAVRVYSVTIYGGTTEKTAYAKDENVVIVPNTPAEGKEVVLVQVIGDNGFYEMVTKSQNSKYKFSMPEEDVMIVIDYDGIQHEIIKFAPTNGLYTVNVEPNNTMIPFDEDKAREGDKVRITTTPNAGYEVESVLVEYATVNKDSEGYYFMMPSSDVNVHVNFRGIQNNIIKNNSTNGTYTVSSIGRTGDTIEIIPTANTGYKLESVSVKDSDNNDVTVTNEAGKFKFTMPNAIASVTVTFKKIDYSVSKESSTNGTFDINNVKANYQDLIEITPNPEDGYEVDKVIVKDTLLQTVPVSLVQDKYTFEMPANNVTVKVTYKKKIYNVQKSNIENGSVSITNQTASIGDTVSFTTLANEGYEIDKVTVKDNANNDIKVTLNNGMYSFTMPNGEVTINANFKKIVFNVEKENVANGTVIVNKETATYQDTIEITPTVNAGYEIDSVLVTDQDNNNIQIVEKDGKYTFKMPSKNVTIKATYKAIVYDIVKEETDNGDYTLDINKAIVGDTVTITALPNLGYELDKITVLDNENKEIPVTAKDGKITFTMIAGNVKINVKYKAIKFEFTKGQNSIYKVGETSEMIFSITGDLSLFNKAYINNIELDKSNYTLTKGSTIMTLKDEYLKTLSNGEYTLKVEYTNGTDVETNFTITGSTEKTEQETLKDGEKETTPKTGDNIILFVGILAIAMLGTAVVVIKKNKINKTSKH